MRAIVISWFWRGCSWLSPEAASALGDRLGRLIGPRLRAGRMVALNLRIAFPGWPPARLREVVRESMGQLGRVIGEYPHLAAICGDSGRSRIEVVGGEILDRLVRERRPAVLVAGHFANWELLAAVAVRRGVALTVVHDRRADRTIEKLLSRRRDSLGCRFIASDASVHGLLAELRLGQSIGVLVDQRYDEGEGIALFGRPAPAPLAPAMLAARLGLPFVPVRLERFAGCQFRVTIEPPIAPDPAITDRRLVARDMTARLYARFEAWITERPEQWLCIKRRWPDTTRRKWQARLARNPRLAGAGNGIATRDDLADERRAG